MQEHINTQRLDDELSKLKAIGIKEISKATKLSSTKIEDVLEKRYDQIDKVRAKGFIAILEREYGVDLRDWILAQSSTSQLDDSSVAEVIGRQDEIERTQRLAQNVAKVEEKQREAKKSHDEHQKSREQQVIELALGEQPKASQASESFNWLYVVLGAVLIGLMGYFAYKAFMEDRSEQAQLVRGGSTQTSAQDSTQSEGGYDGMFFDTTKPQAVLDSEPKESQSSESQSLDSETSNTQASQDDTGKEPQNPSLQNPSSQNLNAQSQNTQATSTPDTPATPAPQAHSTHPEQNFFFNPSQSASSESTQASQASAQGVKDNVLRIRSEHDLWLGVINLKTGAKEQFAYKKEYDIALNPNMLFVMGHASFTLTLNGEEITHGAKAPVRMYYDGTSIVDVNYTRFKQLNGGAEW